MQYCHCCCEEQRRPHHRPDSTASAVLNVLNVCSSVEYLGKWAWGNGLPAWRAGQSSDLQGVTWSTVLAFQGRAVRLLGLGWDTHPAHVICWSQLVQHPLCVSLLASAFIVLDGLATCNAIGKICLPNELRSGAGPSAGVLPWIGPGREG